MKRKKKYLMMVGGVLLTLMGFGKSYINIPIITDIMRFIPNIMIANLINTEQLLILIGITITAIGVKVKKNEY